MIAVDCRGFSGLLGCVRERLYFATGDGRVANDPRKCSSPDANEVRAFFLFQSVKNVAIQSSRDNATVHAPENEDCTPNPRGLATKAIVAGNWHQLYDLTR